MEDILQLSGLVTCIYGNKNSSDFRSGKLQDNPLRDIIGPYGNVVSLLDTHAQKTLGYTPTNFIKFPIRITHPPLH
jgi:hypothetical protein